MSFPSIDSLNCFLEAAKHLNFRAAARAVALTPAALGQRIRQLEELMGQKLFHRTTREVMLTQAGLALLPYAQQTILTAESCVRAARGELGPAPLEITLGTRHELGMSWIVPMLDDLEANQPGLKLHLYFGSGPDMMDRVRGLDIDCAVSSTRITDAKLDFIKLHREDYVFVASPQLLDEQPLVTRADARHHVLIDTHHILPLYRYWRDAAAAFDDIQFDRVDRMGTIEAIRSRVLACKGVAVLPHYFVGPCLERGELVPVFPEVKPRFDHFRLIFRADDPRKTVYGALAQHMLAHKLL